MTLTMRKAIVLGLIGSILWLGNKEMKADFTIDEVGDRYSFTTIEVVPQSTVTASTH